MVMLMVIVINVVHVFDIFTNRECDENFLRILATVGRQNT